MNKHELAYSVLRGRIVDGVYGSGHRLVIDSLARELGISPVPVREAIRRLEAEGWVVYRPNAGAQVSEFDSSQWEQAMYVLALLEGYATALASPHVDPEGIAELRRINTDMARSLEAVDVLSFSRLNREFHFAIYRYCPNDYLIHVLRETWDRLDSIRRTIFQYIPNRGPASFDEHARLIDLIESRAPFAEVEQVAREHKLRTIEAYHNTQQQAAMPGQVAAEGEV